MALSLRKLQKGRSLKTAPAEPAAEAPTEEIESERADWELPGEVVVLPIDALTPNGWNPQDMSRAEFELLLDSMKQGMVDPIQVVPIYGANGDGDRYMILGGEHRWRAAQRLGWEKIPALVLTDEKFKDEDLLKFWTVRLNMIHGKLNPEKFLSLYQEMAKKYEHEALQFLMGFAESDAFNKLVGGVKEAIKSTGVPNELAEAFSDAMEEIKTVDDLSNILNRLFTQYGDTLKYNFMIASYGGKEHLYLKCDRVLWKKLANLRKSALMEEVSLTDVLNDLIPDAKSVDWAKYDKVVSGDDDDGSDEEPENL